MHPQKLITIIETIIPYFLGYEKVDKVYIFGLHLLEAKVGYTDFMTKSSYLPSILP